MGIRTKALFTVVLIGLVVGVMSLSTDNNSRLYKGQIFDQAGTDENLALPDLAPQIELIKPGTDGGDLKVSATLQNSGTGDIASGNPFSYTIYINDQEVFSNTDSYSSMLSGDEFNFVYPIPKSIYNYPNEGVVKFVVDTQNTIEESNEDNNKIEVNYTL